MQSETKTVGGLKVVKHVMAIKGDGYVVNVYEPSSYTGRHGSLFTIGGQVHGDIASRRLPPEIDALPQGQTRWTACNEWRTKNYNEAYAAIVSAFPEAEGGHDRQTGGIRVYG